jgi:hypothetical protein
MNRFEHLVHTRRREQGELSAQTFAELWAESQGELLGDAVELTEGYRSWWSYIPHFINTPGYVYAYAYGQLLALAVYAKYQEQGEAFVPAYLDCWRRAARAAPRSSAGSSTSTSPTPVLGPGAGAGRAQARRRRAGGPRRRAHIDRRGSSGGCGRR